LLVYDLDSKPVEGITPYAGSNLSPPISTAWGIVYPVFTGLPREETVEAIDALLPGNIDKDQISRF
jgi:hypothetical protein